MEDVNGGGGGEGGDEGGVTMLLTSKELIRKAEALCGKAQQTSVGSIFKLSPKYF